MSLIIKTCGMRTSDEIAVAVSAGADAIGCVFYKKSPRFVDTVQANEACRALPQAVLRVAVMHHPSDAEWLQVLRNFKPNVLQTDIEDFDLLSVPPTIKRWPVIRENGVDMRDALPDLFLYEGQKSGKGRTVDWQSAADVARRGQMILAGGLDADNVAVAIETVRPCGVDASSGLESAPGKKSVTRIKQFVAAARAAERYL